MANQSFWNLKKNNKVILWQKDHFVPISFFAGYFFFYVVIGTEKS